MRTTVDIPEELIQEAMKMTHARTKTELLKIALENLINQEKRKTIKKYHGKVDLKIDMETLRER